MPERLADLKCPLVVAEGLDVSFYESVERLEQQLEAIDVREDSYVAYDSEGRLLKLGVTPLTKSRKVLGLTFETPRLPEFVVVEGAEPDPNHESELKALLKGYLRAAGVGEELERNSLSELISRAVAHAGIVR